MATITPPKSKSIEKNNDNIIPEIKVKQKPTSVLNKPSPTETVNLNLTVSNSLKVEYKVFCALQGKNMNTIFEEMFNEYKSKF